MGELPRLAIGTLEPPADAVVMAWALMEALARRGTRVQSFLSHAYFCPRDGATAITGSPPRHLDSWLMAEDVCRRVFCRGAKTSDLALVEGTFCEALDDDGFSSRLSTLCQWLDLPRLAVVDARRLTPCRLPARPAELDGVLLDRVQDAAEYCQLRTHFESLWKVPVLGWLGMLEGVRREIDQVDCGRKPALELCQALGDELTRNARLDAILALAARRPLELATEACAAPPARELRVAVAYDEVFMGYFPDTLDVLEARGATICDFSPLHDERLPPQTDVVYIGCGHPERYVRELSRNDCLMLSLKSHVSSGGRIYAECGGLAYLCQEIELTDGERWPLVGVLPATARYDDTPGAPLPAELQLAESTWLGSAGECLRGYLNPNWTLAAASQLEPCAAGECAFNLVKRHQALGSRVYLNFAAQGALVDRFFEPNA